MRANRSVVLAALLGFAGADRLPAQAWRSRWYPGGWTPEHTDAQGRFLHDFSYAGYRNGEVPLPQVQGPSVCVVDDFGADPTGQTDSRFAVQSAIDAVGGLGGGVVAFPEGRFRFDGPLRVSASHTVLRGAGSRATLLFFTTTPAEGEIPEHLQFTGTLRGISETLLATDGMNRAGFVEVTDSSVLRAGDDVAVGWVITPEFVAEHGMTGTWSEFNGTWSAFFRREIRRIDRTVTPHRVYLDVPLRYEAKVRDGASIRVLDGYLRECGLESLGVANAVDREAAWSRGGVSAIGLRAVKDCWVRDVESSASPLPEAEGHHLQSGGILVSVSKRVTLAGCRMARPQNRGGGGAGYLFHISRSSEILTRDCEAVGGRHNFIQNWGFGASGLVWLRCVSREGRAFSSIHDPAGSIGYSEYHHSLAMACLVDSCVLDDGWFGGNRGAWSSGAGATVTQSVYWNASGQGVIRSWQSGRGYVIGTREIRVETEMSGPFAEGTEPEDEVEGKDQGGRLVPSSLYLDQLARRLSSAPPHPARPHVLIAPEEFDEFRALAQETPWKEMKGQAIEDAARLSIRDEEGRLDLGARDRLLTLRDVISATALAWLLDPDNGPAHAAKLRAEMEDGLGALAEFAGAPGWANHVPVANVLFVSIAALDLIRDEIGPDERLALEDRIDDLASRLHGWPPTRAAVEWMWNLYRGVPPDALGIPGLPGILTDCGVSANGSGYALARFNLTDREHKHLFLDVLERRGASPEGYGNRQLADFYEYLYGYALDPMGRIVPFGDSADTDRIWGHQFEAPGFEKNAHTAIFRASRFSETAARYAAWHLRDLPESERRPPGRLFAYVFAREALTTHEPRLAPSRIFPSAAAFFLEDRQASDALYAALWNPTREDGHSHKEINAVAMTAYGEILLRNAGYAGWGAGGGGLAWEEIHNSARTANTVLMDNRDHAAKSGGGLVRGFTGGGFDFATGFDGGAMPGGDHYRDLWFVDAHGAANGYWILLDRLSGAAPASEAHILFRPYAEEVETVAVAREYRFSVNAFARTDRQVGGTLFLATPPNRVVLRPTGMADFFQSLRTRSIAPVYGMDEAGRRAILTVVFPHDRTRPRADLSRVQGAEYTGAAIRQGPVTDVALESSGARLEAPGGIGFRGLSLWYRREADRLTAFFAQDARFLEDGAGGRLGFVSDRDVTVYVHCRERVLADDADVRVLAAGRIASAQASRVAFLYPGLRGVRLDGRDLVPVAAGGNWVTVDVPGIPGVGGHGLEFVVDAKSRPTPDFSPAPALRYGFDEASSGQAPATDSGSPPPADGLFRGAAARTGNTPGGHSAGAMSTGGGAPGSHVAAAAPGKISGLDAFTLSCWLNLRADPQDTDRILSLHDGANGFDWMIVRPDSGSFDRNRFSLRLDVNGQTAVATGEVSAPEGWVFLAARFEGAGNSGLVRFYAAHAQAPLEPVGAPVPVDTGAANAAAAEFRVGCAQHTAGDRTPDAEFDDVRVYTRALAPGELERVRRAGIGAPPPFPVMEQAGFRPEGGFRLRVLGEPGRRIVLEAAGSLAGEPAWEPVATNTARGTRLTIDDPGAAAHTQRFYRAVMSTGE